MKKVKYHIHMSNTSVLLIFFSVLFYKEDICIAVISSLFIHEAGHILLCIILKVEIAHIHIHPHGINMCLDTMPTPKKQLAVSLSGPFLSLIVSMLFLWLYHIFNISVFNLWASVNFLMFAVNIIPAFPLDGGEILRAFLCFFRGCIESVNIVKKISVYVLICFMLLGVMIALIGNLNPSLTLFCIVGLLKLSDCVVYKYNSVMNIMSGNFVSNRKRHRLVSIYEGEDYVSLICFISTEYTLLVNIYSYDGIFIRQLSQDEILKSLIDFNNA